MARCLFGFCGKNEFHLFNSFVHFGCEDGTCSANEYRADCRWYTDSPEHYIRVLFSSSPGKDIVIDKPHYQKNRRN